MILKFLYDARQLANPPLDLSDAQLNNIDFTDSSPMYHVSLVGVHSKKCIVSSTS